MAFHGTIFAFRQFNIHLAGQGTIVAAFCSGTEFLNEILMIVSGIVERPLLAQIAPGPVVHEPFVAFIRHSVKIRPYSGRLFEDMFTQFINVNVDSPRYMCFFLS